MPDIESKDRKDEAEGHAQQKPENEGIEQDAQDGVRIMEAMTLSWSRASLGLIYFWYVHWGERLYMMTS